MTGAGARAGWVATAVPEGLLRDIREPAELRGGDFPWLALAVALVLLALLAGGALAWWRRRRAKAAAEPALFDPHGELSRAASLRQPATSVQYCLAVESILVRAGTPPAADPALARELEAGKFSGQLFSQARLDALEGTARGRIEAARRYLEEATDTERAAGAGAGAGPASGGEGGAR